MISIANLNRALFFLGIVILFFIIAVGNARAQATSTDGATPPGIAPGAPAGAYALSGFENVNLYSGNLNVNLPLLSIGGRGSALTAITLALNTNRWRVIKTPNCGPNPPPPGCTSFLYFPTFNWWTPREPGYSPGVMIGRNSGFGAGPTNLCGSGPTWSTTLARLTFTSADGTEYEFRDKLHQGQPQSTLGTVQCPFGASRGTEFVTHDGTSATFISDSVIRDGLNVNDQYFFPTGTMVMRDGTRYRIVSGLVESITDRNGNRIVFTYVANRVTKIVDSLKREVNITYDNPGGSGTKYDTISFKGTNGTVRTIEVWRTLLSNALRADYPEALTPEQLFEQLDGSNATDHNPEDMVSEVKLPGGRSYKFRYNPYGELARIELPTGGAFEYEYGGGDEFVSENFYLLNRRITQRRTLPDGNPLDPESRTTYELTRTSDPVLTYLSTVVVNHLNQSLQVTSKEEHYFYGWSSLQGSSSSAYSGWKEGREYKTKMLNELGLVLREENYDWSQPAVSWWTSNQNVAPTNKPRITESIRKIDGGLQSRQTFEYDDYLNKTEVREYDLGSAPSGGLLRRTSTLYSSTELINGINYATNTNIHMPGLPVKQFIYDGSGTLMAKTEYEYDVYSGIHHAALVNRADMVSHDGVNYGPSFLTRGNLTSRKVWLNTSNSWISTFQQYDIAGNVVVAIDGLQNPPTTFNFTDKFGTSNGQLSDLSTISELAPNKKTYAFASSVTNALGHTATAQFDYYTGAVVDSKDANGVVTTAYYNDALDRPTSAEIRAVEGGSVYSRSNFSYSLPPFTSPNPLTITVAKDLNSLGDGSLKSEVVYDGLGRTKESRQYESASAYIATKTEYDWMGRVSRTENPQRAANESTDGYAETTYDALSRIRFVKTYTNSGQLTGTVETQYSGNQTTIIDQAGKKRRSITDGLGRIKQVDELNTNGTVYAMTLYQYSALDNLVKVTQDGQQRYFLYDSLNRLVRVRNPEQQINGNIVPQLTDPLTGNNQWVMKYDYDNNGNIKEKVDPRNIKTLYNYDALNRPTSRSYDPASTPAVSYFYDNQTLPTNAPTFNRGDSTGRLVAMTYGSGSSEGSYTGYDDWGRVSTSIQRTDAVNYSMSYEYNLADGLTSQMYPSGKIYKTDYDSVGRLNQVRRFNGQTQEKVYVSQMQYWPHGGMKSMTLDNNTVETMEYNSQLQITKIELRKTDNKLLLGLDYTYNTAGQANNNGNVRSQDIRIEQGGSITTIKQSYEYDALNRLQWAEESISAQIKWRQTYDYDRFGNRMSLVNTGSEWQLLPTQSTPAVDTATNRLSGYGYDFAGNMTAATGSTFGYDAENRQVNFNGGAASYVYDGDGKRVKKVVGGVATIFVYNADGQLIAEYGQPQGSGTSYLTSDNLGSTRLVAKDTGVIKRYDYLPFGEEIPSNVSGRGSVTGYTANDSTRQRFTSKERDNESALDYFLARYHSSAQGRFTSVDPMNDGPKAVDPQGWNGYAYARNNPVFYVDLTGLYYEVYDSQGKFIGRVNHIEELAKLGYIYEKSENNGQLIHFKGGYTAKFFEDAPAPVIVSLGRADAFIMEMGRRAPDLLKAVDRLAELTLTVPSLILPAAGVARGITSLNIAGRGTFNLSRAYATGPEMLQGVRELEAGFAKSKYFGPAKPVGSPLTDLQRRALMENIRNVINKTIETAKSNPAALQSVRNQLANPRFAFLTKFRKLNRPWKKL